MSGEDPLLAEIVELAQDHTDAKSIGPETRLHADLGMTGDDAHEFLLAFSTKYGVDMETLIWLRYFDDEPNSADLMVPAIAMAASLVSPSFAARWDAAHDAEREITLAHLADVARTKTWRHPSEAFKRARAQPPLLLAFSAMSALAMAFFVVMGLGTAYAFLTGELGEMKALPLIGIVAMSVLPVFLAFASWRGIQRMLASAKIA